MLVEGEQGNDRRMKFDVVMTLWVKYKALKVHVFLLPQSNSEALTTKLSTRTQEVNTLRLENEQLKVKGNNF